MNPDKKQRIMQAAEHLFRTRQFHEITLDEIAGRAGIGKGTIYLYFSDKDDLFFQTAVAGYDEMCELLRENAEEGVSFREGLLRTCETISTFFRQRRPLFRLILTEGEHAAQCGGSLRKRWLERRESMREAVAAIVARGIASGDVHSMLSADVLAEYFLGMLRTRAWELEDQPKAQRSHASVVTMFVHGVSGHPAP